jgi:predicted thioesterase
MKPGIEHGVGVVTLVVTDAMTAHLEGHVRHRVYGTYFACYHAELASRRAIEPFFDEGDNAVGSALSITHHTMAPVGATLIVTATVTSVNGRRVVCCIQIEHDGCIVATGAQEQALLPTDVIEQRIKALYPGH